MADQDNDATNGADYTNFETADAKNGGGEPSVPGEKINQTRNDDDERWEFEGYFAGVAGHTGHFGHSHEFYLNLSIYLQVLYLIHYYVVRFILYFSSNKCHYINKL